MLPSLGKYSSLSIAEDASHSVSYDRSFKTGEGDDEETVAPEDIGKAYKVIGIPSSSCSLPLFQHIIGFRPGHNLSMSS